MITIAAKGKGKNRIRSIESARKRVKRGQNYLISRHNAWFRPDAHGYTNELAAAGVFSAEDAKGYLDVEGVSVVPLQSIKPDILRLLQQTFAAANALAKMYEL